ncbi:unnamed protein product [Owenia fusiformis]|uniref:t-SNARE coiled-coil homology domain-containing protein n=1 Tax=Owenia fusiformis TaxID=6347 RepID=A0A8S4P264_OWEFU|nr:unnamed protein product [Owenia fusiformis]
MASISEKGSMEDHLVDENQRMSENLAQKVNRLKGIAFDMESETKDQNRFIDGVDDDFNSTTGLLSGSFGRITHMVQSGKGNRKMQCYIILGLVGLFFIAYFLISRVRTG